MTPEEAPPGTVVIVGHPGNGCTATKRLDGFWYENLYNRRIQTLDPRDVTAILFEGKD